MGWLQDILSAILGGTSTETRRPRAAARAGRVFKLVNPEGEFQEIDTGDPNSPFCSPGWEKFCSAVEKRELLLGRVADQAIRYQRDERNDKVEGGEQSQAGWLVQLDEIDLGQDSMGRQRLAFLPMRYSSRFSDGVDHIGRFVWVSVVSFDCNSMKIVVQEVPQAKPITNKWTAKQFLRRLQTLIQAASANEEVRGVIYEAVEDQKRGGLAGFRVDVDGHAVFMPASQSMELSALDRNWLIGLPVCGLLDVDDERQQLVLSIRRLYNAKIGGLRYPMPGTRVEAISWAVVEGEWLWLLPRRRTGFVQCREVGLSPKAAQDSCGWIGEVQVVSEEAGTNPDEAPRYRIRPLFER